MTLPRHWGSAPLVLSTLLACSGARVQERPAVADRPAAAPEAPAPAPAEAPVPAPVRETAEAPPERHIARELRDALFPAPALGVFVNLGDPSGAGATLGGFGTSVRPRVVDGVRSALVGGTVARLAITMSAPMHGEADEGAHEWALWLRLRAFVDTPVTAYWQGEVVGHFDAGTEFARVRLPLDEVPEAGETGVLMLRARRRGSLGAQRASMAIDWVAMTPEAPPEDVGPSMALRPRWGLRHELMPRESERLVVEGSDSLRVVAEVDGEAPRIQEGGGELSLEGWQGRVVRTTLLGEGASVERLALSEAPRESEDAPRPRNVLLILIDTLRADKLRPYDRESRVTTPALQQFVQGASTFERAHTQENWTKPSVATLLTSRMPWQHRATEHASVLPRNLETLPERLKAAGFTTASFICNGFVSDRFGFDQGWDAYRNYIREGRRTRSEFVAADVLEWLDGRESPESPFFLYVHTIDPHVPYRPPRDILAQYGDPDYRGPVNFSRDATLLEHVKLGQQRLGARDRRHLEALYDGEITYHDRHFGAILRGLDARGLADDTMVVITSDHGEEFWDHGSVGHGHSVYEELLHVPLFVRLPGETPQRVDDAVGLVDIMPTILDALGLPPSDAASGHSFLPALRGHSRPVRGTVSGFMDNWRTYVLGRYKIIERPRARTRLFDLEEDPDENTPLTNHAITTSALRRRMGLELERTRGHGRARGQTTTIDAETAAQLRALGYVE